MPRYRMFIDDTGDVEDPATNAPERRYASITGIIIEWDHYHGGLSPYFEQMKTKHFGETRKERAPILRRHDLINALGPFECLKDPLKRKAWDETVLSFYERANYKVITVALDKIAWYYRFPNWRGDIYQELIQLAVERYYFFLRSENSTGDVMVEQMGKKKDQAIKKRYRHILENGFQQHRANALQSRLTSVEIKIKPKSDNIAGLQIADLLAAVSFQWMWSHYGNGVGPAGMSAQVAEIIRGKYYARPNGNPHGYGCIWRPR